MNKLSSRRVIEVMLLLAGITAIAAFFALNWAASPKNVQGIVGSKALEMSLTGFDLMQAETEVYSAIQPFVLAVILASLIAATLLTAISLGEPGLDRRVILLRALFGVLIIVSAIVSRAKLVAVDVDYAATTLGNPFDVTSDPIYDMSHAFFIALIAAVLMILPVSLLRQTSELTQ